MKSSRRLALKREVLAELETADLHVVAGAPPEIPTNTCFSCLTYISCNPVACLPTLRCAFEVDTTPLD